MSFIDFNPVIKTFAYNNQVGLPPTYFEPRVSNLQGLLISQVGLAKYFIDLPDDARVVSAQVYNLTAQATDAGTATLKAEFYNQWNGVPTSADFNAAFIGGAIDRILTGIVPGTLITVNQLNLIPFHGYITHRYKITGLVASQATGENKANGTPILRITYTRSNQPVLVEPANGGVVPVNTAFAAKWQHVNGDGLGQGRYVLEVNINGAGWVVDADVQTANEQHTWASNRFALSSVVQWRVTTYAVNELTLPSVVSPVFQFTVRPQGVTPVVTAPAGQIAVATVTITWTNTDATRTAWEARIVKVSDSSVVATSGEKAGQALLWAAVNPDASPVILANTTNYRAEVRVKTQFGVWSAWGQAAFNTVFNPPPKPLLILTPMNAAGYMLVGITNPVPGAGQDVALYNIIERINEYGEWEIIRAEYPINTGYADLWARSKTIESYRVTAVGSTGGVMTSLTYAATLDLHAGFWIHDAFDSASLMNIEVHQGAMSDQWGFEVEYVKYEGRRGFVAHEDDEHEINDFDASFVILTRTTPFYPVNKWPLFDALMRRKSTYVIRPMKGGRFKGKIDAIQKDIVTSEGMMHAYRVSLHLTGTDMKEADI
jgi:hypothetical protein